MDIGEEQEPIELPLPTMPEEVPHEEAWPRPTQPPLAPEPAEPVPVGTKGST
jgi:hypothetical protein